MTNFMTASLASHSTVDAANKHEPRLARDHAFLAALALTFRTAAMNAFSRRCPTCRAFTLRGAFFDLVPREMASALVSNTRRGTGSLADATNVQGTSWPFFTPRAEFIGFTLARWRSAVRQPEPGQSRTPASATAALAAATVHKGLGGSAWQNPPTHFPTRRHSLMAAASGLLHASSAKGKCLQTPFLHSL